MVHGFPSSQTLNLWIQAQAALDMRFQAPGSELPWFDRRSVGFLEALMASHPESQNCRCVAMGQIQIVPPVNIPLPTKIVSKMGGEFTENPPKWDPKTVLTTTAMCQPNGPPRRSPFKPPPPKPENTASRTPRPASLGTRRTRPS